MVRFEDKEGNPCTFFEMMTQGHTGCVLPLVEVAIDALEDAAIDVADAVNAKPYDSEKFLAADRALGDSRDALVRAIARMYLARPAH